ncbi:hypothetical protein F4808DRAFT_442212 [Astrocystis sublimbata]|nr:hypothetical protein F4808DRAFT_442212 [Astrocystis sublimbata]
MLRLLYRPCCNSYLALASASKRVPRVSGVNGVNGAAKVRRGQRRNITMAALPFLRPKTLPEGFTMSRCTPGDVQGMAEVYMDAFGNTTSGPTSDKSPYGDGGEYTYWWGPPSSMTTWNAERIRRRFADIGTQQFKVVEDATGQIVAWAKWDLPLGAARDTDKKKMADMMEGFSTYEDEVENGGKRDGGKGSADEQTSAKSYAQGPPEGANVVSFHDFFDGLVGAEKKYRTEEKLSLTHLCTRYSHHSRGLGSALVRPVLDMADRDGVTAYLEATRLAVPAYRRLGFEVVDEVVFDRSAAGFDTPVTLQIMIREPRALQG